MKRAEVALRLIDEPERALRRQIDPTEVESMAESIQRIGLLQPIGVVKTDGRYRVAYGHRRYLACRVANLDPVPVVILDGTELDASRRQAAENMVRRDLSPIEEAKALAWMVDGEGQTIEDVARSCSRSEVWVRGRLEMLRWPAAIVEACDCGEINAGVAGELVRVEDEATREHYLRCAVESGAKAGLVRRWRLDWELSRHPTPETGEPVVATVPVGSARIPAVVCEVCSRAHPVTASRLVRCCLECSASLEAALAQREEAAEG